MNTPRKYSKLVLFSAITISSLALVAWSPPGGAGDLILIGTSNTFPAAGYRGFLAGNSNVAGSGSPSGYAGIIGSSNTVNAVASLVAGNSNNLAQGATNFAQSLAYSGVFGNQNTVVMDCDTLLISGMGNSIKASSSFAAGQNNTLDGPTTGTLAYSSAAIGFANHVAAQTGWALGKENSVTAENGVAIGTGASADTSSGTALGQYNSPMESGDVLVIGNGTDTTQRSTAFTVKSDGGVVLGRAQGDISMGIYGN